MFKTFLASLGLGAAKIDLVLDQEHCTMGEEVTGEIILSGGEVEQKIENLSVHFCLTSNFTSNDQTIFVDEMIATVSITNDPFTVQVHDTIRYPFRFTCPINLPVSAINTHFFFRTNLEIAQGKDKRDIDYIEVRPTGLLANFLQGFHLLGMLPHREAYTGSKYGQTQIMQFYPTTWLKGQYDEIEFRFQPGMAEHGVSGFFELDKKTSGLMGMIADKLDLDEKKGRFSFNREDLVTSEQAAATIKHFITHHSEKLVGKEF